MSNTEKKASITDQIDFQIEIVEQRAFTIHIPTNIEVLQRVGFYFDRSLSIATLRVFERLMRASKQTTYEFLRKPFHIALRSLAVFD